MDLPTLIDLDNIDLSYIQRNSSAEKKWLDFVIDKAPNYYKLLAWFSEQYTNEIIIEVGTFKGLSAMALAYNPKNYITTFDIVDNNTIKWWHNINFKINNVYNFKELILSSKFIFFDTVHDGVQEKKFHDFLIHNNYKGKVMYDDIYLNDEMKKFWYNINTEKYDLTNIGHWSGTGLVVYS